ncbi:hypothetical protein [Marmoricola sp. RAF53]|uniref:hypothetical protein n=1 Tax=Marmoricola sp. RAF53 TaxID=3233059 RepID=UPI003F95E461
MKHFVGGLDDDGLPVPLSPAILRTTTEDWPRASSTPAGVEGLLKTSRDLFVCSYFAYEFLTVAVLVSLQAVEAALRSSLGSDQRLATLSKRARAEGLVTQEQFEVLEAGRQLRNEFSHPAEPTVWTFGMAGPCIEVAHLVVADIFG